MIYRGEEWQENSFTLKAGRFQVDIRKKFFPVRVGRSWNTFPEKMWLLLDPWKCPRPGWMELGELWDNGRCPWQRVGTD